MRIDFEKRLEGLTIIKPFVLHLLKKKNFPSPIFNFIFISVQFKATGNRKLPKPIFFRRSGFLFLTKMVPADLLSDFTIVFFGAILTPEL